MRDQDTAPPGSRGRASETPTVVMLTHERPASACNALDRLASLAPRPEVIVVDNGSRDATPAVIERRHPWARLMRLPADRAAEGRNAGVRAAEGEYVALCDDDSWWAPDALRRAAVILDEHPDVGAVCARILVGGEGREDPVCAVMRDSPLPRGPDARPAVVGFLACGVVARRAMYLEAGGFDERFGIGGEEELLALDLLAAGHRLVYADDVVAHHDPPARTEAAAAHRRALGVRSRLWCAWLRRPGGRALGITAATARAAAHDPATRAGLAGALRGLPAIRRERRSVSRSLDRRLATAAHSQPTRPAS